MEIGYALICEEHAPEDLVRNGQQAAEAGFELLSVSDHFHPWLEEQGHSPFAWSVMAALGATTDLPLVSLVTCPIKRYHPAIVAQMAATTDRLAGGGLTLGLGTGENLNEHVVGGEWADPGTRQQQLEEAIEIIRELFGGEEVSRRGRWFTVDRARLFTRPEQPTTIAVAAGGTRAAELAARIGAGLVTVGPGTDYVEAYREAGGEGPIIGQASCCWDDDEDRARSTFRQRWRHSPLGWDANAEIPTPAGFAAVTQTVREEDVVGAEPIGDDVDAYLESLEMFADTGFDRVVLHNVGTNQRAFIEWAGSELLPRLRG